MLAENRIYRTEDDRLVNESDPAAAYLKYAKGDEIEKADEKRLPAPNPAADPDLNKAGTTSAQSKAVRQSPNK